jgi:hypothetical protein
MASEPIHIHDDSELARLLDEAEDRPLTFYRKGRRYTVTQVDDEGTEYDPDALREAVRHASGIFSDDEAEEFRRKIYEYRQAGSRPEDRP